MAGTAAAVWYRGEWFEAYNPTAGAVDLDGLVVSDDSGESLSAGSSVIVDAGEYAVFAVRDDPWQNGGLPRVDYRHRRSAMTLFIADDEIVLSNSDVLIAASGADVLSRTDDGEVWFLPASELGF